MSDNNIPDENIKGSNKADDEEIIDLTEVVQDASGEDDDIIELTDTITEDEEILDLTDVAPDVEPGTEPAGDDEDEILELTDMVSEEPEGRGGDDEVIDLVDAMEEEDVIELTDVEEEAPAVKESEEDVDKELLALIESINDDDISGSEIDDADVDNAAEDSEEDLLEPDEEIDVLDDSRVGQDTEEKKVFAESLDEDLGSVLTYSEEDESVDEGEKPLDRPGVVSVKVQDLRDEGRPVDFKFESKLQPGDKLFREKDYNKVITEATSEQVEEAVRKVIKEMLADKIDDLITDVIEKKVLQEIDRIKNLLLYDAEHHK